MQRSNVKQNTSVCYLYCLSAQEPQSQPRMPFCKMLYKQNKEHMSQGRNKRRQLDAGRWQSANNEIILVSIIVVKAIFAAWSLSRNDGISRTKYAQREVYPSV